jgi:hypothetical protein
MLVSLYGPIDCPATPENEKTLADSKQSTVRNKQNGENTFITICLKALKIN